MKCSYLNVRSTMRFDHNSSIFSLVPVASPHLIRIFQFGMLIFLTAICVTLWMGMVVMHFGRIWQITSCYAKRRGKIISILHVIGYLPHRCPFVLRHRGSIWRVVEEGSIPPGHRRKLYCPFNMLRFLVLYCRVICWPFYLVYPSLLPGLRLVHPAGGLSYAA